MAGLEVIVDLPPWVRTRTRTRTEPDDGIEKTVVFDALMFEFAHVEELVKWMRDTANELESQWPKDWLRKPNARSGEAR